MKKKGFTLIELLAVIIILAIVALVATPIILNVVNDAKKSAGLSEAKMIYSGINNYCEEAKLKEQLNGTESICKDGVTIEEVNQMVNLGNAKIIKLTYTNKVTELTVESNGYIYTLKDGEIVLGEDGNTGGEEVTINNCTDLEHPNPQPGDIFIDGQYKYVYKQKFNYEFWGSGIYDIYWSDIEEDGWGVHFNDLDAKEITTQLCSTINGKPIVNMKNMFYGSETGSSSPQLTVIDLKKFDTSNVTDMSSMFAYSPASEIIFGDNFDTSNVTNMYEMFYNSNADELDLLSFDTSNVTNMSSMFSCSQAVSLDLSSFNTSNVTNMFGMFSYSQATEIVFGDNFDTSNVTNMGTMFEETKLTSLDLSNFNVGKVENMRLMFSGSQATEIVFGDDFNTINVTDMSSMFSNSQVTSLDLSSFDTSNVTDMSYMFSYSQATNIDVSSFNIGKVMDMNSMFKGSQASILDLSSFDLKNNSNLSAYNGKLSYMFENAVTTTGYAKTQADANTLNATPNKPSTLTFIVKPTS